MSKLSISYNSEEKENNSVVLFEGEVNSIAGFLVQAMYENPLFGLAMLSAVSLINYNHIKHLESLINESKEQN